MTLDELLARIKTQDPEALAGVPGALARRVVKTALRELRRCLDAQGAAPLGALDNVDGVVLDVPELGRFSRQPRHVSHWRFTPQPLAGSAIPTAVASGIAQQAWRQACNAGDPALIHPEHKFALLFSPKSACSSVVIWFLHTMGLADEARAYSEWPHDYRIQQWVRSEAHRATRQIPPEALTVLRVVRDPLDRAVSSFRHALGTGYARETIQVRLGRDIRREGLSFQQFIDFLALEDLDTCDPHHRRQCHPVERLRAPDVVINASRQDLFAGLNDFERRIGMPTTDFAALRWIHELQSTRVPHRVDDGQPADELVLTQAQARHGPWPHQLLTPAARERLSVLYADDIARYAAS